MAIGCLWNAGVEIRHCLPILSCSAWQFDVLSLDFMLQIYYSSSSDLFYGNVRRLTRRCHPCSSFENVRYMIHTLIYSHILSYSNLCHHVQVILSSTRWRASSGRVIATAGHSTANNINTIKHNVTAAIVPTKDIIILGTRQSCAYDISEQNV